ncbi:exodeoxyribonuclease VII large subunit [Alistipes sp. kh20]|uniref:exodeoxyribonuclease VII large subunit n=1 Tax=Alistipes montrealensis TaxID=2834113 RepID=UPI001BCEB4D9|nr:exodeoxyribonuclease VII large subunit [Alistipes montrealensis]MBS4765334.1 exodeoxyribonuclease VII large subunit [Alistipes montrealensis]
MAESQHITLRELQRRVKSALEGQFALPVWVSAEISEIKVNYSGHCYLELVEKGGDNGVPTAQARAVVWRSHYPRISGYFEAETGQRLASGIRILAKVLVSYHELYGFSLQITDIDPSYTLGDMERQRQQTIAQLQQDGVWDMNREATMPAVVQRIAIVSSANAAGYQDFCKELDKSPYRFTLTLFDAFMQGAAAEESIIEALCSVAARMEDFDAVVLIRGGGSRSDLNCFNAYRLCAHVAQFPLPVVTGIGHDKDTSVADMVAHTALKTPTAVAGWLVGRMAETDGWLDYAALQLHDTTTAAMHASEVRLERLSGEVRRLSGELLTRQSLRLEHHAALLPDAARDFLARQNVRLGNAAELIAGRSPERILRLGFAVVRTGGKAVTSAREVGAGENIEIEVSDGQIEATVKAGKIWQKKS